MCGIVGFIGDGGTPDPALLIRRMAGSIHHRGPDHTGYWLDDRGPVVFGHKRLSIVDVSSAGEQPMRSPSGRYVIIYNGEIYNHMDLRRQLREAGHSFDWRGHSDTETLLAAIDAWGVRGAIARCIGMFAFGLWDVEQRALVLARDRLGEKPLYYGWQGEGAKAAFLFGSEIKALAEHPAFDGEIDRQALSLFLRHNYVPAPYSIYRGIRKLRPGSLLTVSMTAREPVEESYWSAGEVAKAGIADPFRGSPEAAVDELEKLLLSAVGQQMVADVPLGAFLSGGVNSSTIVALMQAQSSRPVKTFSIGFSEANYNEAESAGAVARHLGTDHTELYVSADEAMAVIPRLPTIYDEPFADSSQIPTFLVSQLARRHVTVSLSGDAGDELFAGYNRYALARRLWKSLAAIPAPLRRQMARGLLHVSPAAWDRVGAALGPLMPKLGRVVALGDKLHKGAGVLASRDSAQLYHGLTSHWQHPESVVIDGPEPPTLLTGDAPPLDGLTDIERMMALDLMTYLPDDILTKVDRASMATSLEARVPFLDHRVVEFAWRLPLDYKLRHGTTKWPLRQVLYRYVPRELIERPKQGFGIPIDHWLRGPLRGWAEELLDEGRLRDQGYFRPEPIRKLWQAHQEGRVSVPNHLWSVLMFQAWLETRSSSASSGDAGVGPLARAVG